MGLIGRPGTAALAGENRRSCTLVVLFSRGGPGGAVGRGRRGSVRVLNEPVRGDLGRGGNRGSRRRGIRND